jgi:hypothetical protein
MSWPRHVVEGKQFMFYREISLVRAHRSLVWGFALVLSAFGASAVQAQGMKTEFFLAPEARISRVAGGTAVTSGFNTGWIINKSLILGGTSFGTNYGIEPNVALASGESKAEFKYRGGMIGWQFKTSPSLKASITTVIGKGKLQSLATDKTVLADRVWVFEPMANLTLKLNNFASLSTGAGYRMTAGGEYKEITSSDLRSPVARIGLSLGGW